MLLQCILHVHLLHVFILSNPEPLWPTIFYRFDEIQWDHFEYVYSWTVIKIMLTFSSCRLIGFYLCL